MTSNQKYSVDEILNLVEADNNVISANIYLCPPTNWANSDEDSGEEDEADINRLTKNQLLANAEANITRIHENEVISEHITLGNSIKTETVTPDLNNDEGSGAPANQSQNSNNKQAKVESATESVVNIDFGNDNTIIEPISFYKRKIEGNVSSLPSTLASSVTTILADDNPSATKKRKVSIREKYLVNAKDIQNKTTTPVKSKTGQPVKPNTSKPVKPKKGKTIKPKTGKPVTPKKVKKAKTEYNWVKKDLEGIPNKEWELPQWLCSKDWSPVELFELFYDVEVITLICDMTNKYASEKGEQTGYTLADIKCFIAILLVSGYNQVPRVKMYWETKVDVWNKAISEAMPRNKFLNILRCFHVCDNANLDKNSKFAKIIPLWNMLNERGLRYFPGDANLSIDESMILYYGRHSAKQHIHGKPIRFGYKAWCLCSRLGYLIQAIPYEGASTKNKYPEIGVGGSVVMELAEKLPPRNDGYNLFFDNFFTSVKLLEELKKSGNTGTGTVKANRVCQAPLTDVKSMKKTPRGTYEQLTEEKNDVTLVRYNDNNVCTVASTYCGVEPLSKVRRYSAADKKHIMVPQPSCVLMYNQYMGGVDRLDENISKLRIGIRGKKWYWQLLVFPINVSVNNAWLLYRLTTMGKEKPLDLLSFTREITLTYLKKYSCRVGMGRRLHYNVGAVDKRVTADIRYDNEGHMIDKSESQTRCGQCKKNTTMKCVKCGIALHSKCFILFHSK